MFVKLTILACSLAVACGVWNGPLAGGTPADLYPAGVSPHACPNYPNCANPALAANPSAPAPYGGAPAWNQPAPSWNQYNPAPVPQYGQSALDKGEYTGDGDYHGEGLAESGAYGNTGQYNQWDNGNSGQWNGNNNGQWNSAPAWNAAPAHGAAQLPAGVSPQACPNYPFCH